MGGWGGGGGGGCGRWGEVEQRCAQHDSFGQARIAPAPAALQDSGHLRLNTQCRPAMRLR